MCCALAQVWRGAGPSSTPSRRVRRSSLPATTSRTVSCGSRPCTGPRASPTSPCRPPRCRNSTPEGAPHRSWTHPYRSSVSPPLPIFFWMLLLLLLLHGADPSFLLKDFKWQHRLLPIETVYLCFCVFSLCAARLSVVLLLHLLSVGGFAVCLYVSFSFSSSFSSSFFLPLNPATL